MDRRSGGEPEPILQGNFTNIIDLAVDRFGRLYVLEIFHNNLLSGSPEGALFRVTGDESLGCTRRASSTPGGLDVGPGGVLYISNKATSAGSGELLRLKPDPNSLIVASSLVMTPFSAIFRWPKSCSKDFAQ